MAIAHLLESATYELPGGPFTARQALSLGLSRRELDRAVAGGELRRVFHDVYVASTVPDTTGTRLDAVRLVLPEHAVVDRTAAWLWGAEAVTSTPEEVPRLEVFVLRGNKRMTRPGASGGERDLAPQDVTERGGVPVTAPARTCLDLACGLRPYDAIALMDVVARCQGVTVFDLMALLPRFRGRRGVVQARALVQLVDSRSESSGESITRLAIHEAELPKPTPQFWVTVDGIPTYRLDLAYPRHKVAVEYDGVEFHTSPAQRQADEDRRAHLRAMGWTVIVVTKDSFTFDAREGWLRDLRHALAGRD